MTASLRTVPCICCGHPTLLNPQAILDAIPMSRHQRVIANRLARSFGRFVNRNDLIEAIYGNRPDGGPTTAPKIVDIEIHYLRTLLSTTPLAIQTAARSANSSGRRLAWRGAS